MAELVPLHPVKEFNATDLGNAERLADWHGADLRFVPNVGWHAWDGRRWQYDDSGEVMRRAKKTVRRIARDADKLPGKQRESAIKHSLKSEATGKLEAMISSAESEERLVARVDDFDSDHWILNVKNGTVDLRTGNLHPHSRYDHITKLAPASYVPDAQAPLWTAFLDRIFADHPELVSFVQRAVGYSLTGSTAAQVMFVLHGRGANGKSTFLERIRAVLGDYAQQAPTDLLMASRTNRGGATPDLARLPGARFVSAVETGDGRRLDEPLVKQITGGDRIAARRLYRDVFEFTPTHKLWLATNHLPEVRGTDEAIWRRVKLVPFTVTIPDAERDGDLPRKLETELDGILAWAIHGARAYQERGLDEPDIVRQATKSYRDEMDDLGAFLDECALFAETVEAAADATKASVLYTRYEYWCREVGAEGLTATAFGRRLTERGIVKEKRRDGWYYPGISLAGSDQGRLN